MAIERNSRSATIAFQRFGFGAKPGDLAGVASDPVGAVMEDVLQRRVAQPKGDDLLTTSDAFEFLDEFKSARKLAREREQKASAAAAMPTVSAMQGMDQSGMQGGKPADSMASPPKPAEQPPRPQVLFRAEMTARFDAACAPRVGFAERLVWFWSNHFCVSVAKGQNVRVAAGPFEREAIRPHVFGRFADMLLAVERHPAMLIYLDNRQSVGANSKFGERRNKGLNENLGREILELHTLGAGGGYTQKDVTSLANIITGWTVVGPNDETGEMGQFQFNPGRHEPGPHAVLGKTYPQSGEDQGIAALRDIARHPATAKHIATKLVRHFVADVPPPALVDTLTRVFLKSDGDLAAVSTALIEAPEAWTAEMTKFRSPQEFALALVRASGGKVDVGQINGTFTMLGQPLWQPNGPNGFADTEAAWATPEGMKARLDIAGQAGKRAGDKINPSELAQALYGDALSQDTRQAIARAESKPQGLAILIMSPEFQRR